ncbi:hypothetical protein ABZ519_19250 [Streptomyces collinus]|uniref:hypothetical protein n=1 Tax=Streptomyces collinus TaxID=42684 RepID=UPI00340DFE53
MAAERSCQRCSRERRQGRRDGGRRGRQQRGTATSLQATALFGGQFASPLVFGPLMDATSIATAAPVAATGRTGILMALFRLKNPQDADETGSGVPQHEPAGEQS